MNKFAYDVMSAAQGKTHIFSVGQAGFIIKSASGSILGIDLYLSNCVERLEGHKGFKRLLPQILQPSDLKFDVLVCTHPHWDHFDVDAVPELLSGGGTKLFCSEYCRKLVSMLNLDYYGSNIAYVKPGDSCSAGEFGLKFVNCDHGSGAPDAVGAVISVDGRTIYETGDTCLRLDRLNELPAVIDVLIAPINGAYGNMNEEECALLACTLRPCLTVPCHYGMFASHQGEPWKFYDIMTGKDLPFLLMRQGECYTFQ